MNPAAETSQGRTQGQREALEPGSWYLLEIGSKTVHVLVIGEHGVGLAPEAVDIPDAQ